MIYLVCVYTGCWDDSWWHIHSAWSTQEDAIRAKSDYEFEIRKLKAMREPPRRGIEINGVTWNLWSEWQDKQDKIRNITDIRVQSFPISKMNLSCTSPNQSFAA